MKTLMIDMDDVITNGNFNKYIEEFMNIKIDMTKITNYEYVQDLVKSKKEEFWKYVENKDLYKGAPLFKDCYEVLKKLNDKYDLYIVTSYLWTDVIDISGKNLGYKYYYLKEMLPFINPSKYIFTTNKNLLNFDIKIDDKITNLEGADIKILFNRWHNINKKYDKNIIRVNNWKEIEEVLL
ncbi:MAG: hypothetical protein IJ097_02180 [Bacilli bacterium]|nr:hypothetical protein [Bacilli bacterium]